MFKDLKKYTRNIFAEDLKDNNFNPSTIPNYSSNLDSSLASNSTLSIPCNADLRPSVIDKNRPIESIRLTTRNEKYEVGNICQLLHRSSIYT